MDISLYKNLSHELNAADVKLVAVSKTKPVEDILELYEQGQRVFGENRVQELLEKYEALPKDIEWHLIGHLQRNKVKYIAPFVALIHSIDNYKLLKEVNKYAKQHERVIECLLQIKVAEEESKHGFSPSQLNCMLQDPEFTQLKNIHIRGVMGMASFTSNKEQLHQEFHELHDHFDSLRAQYFKSDPAFRECSMGMSGDYQIAINEGSTMVRIGSLLFGSH